MKKLLLGIIVIAGTSFSGSAQALSQGSIVADVYYGFPNLYKTTLEAAYIDSGEDFAVGGYGPVGVRGEYLLSEKLGIGVDFMINNTNVSYNYSGYEYSGQDDDGMWIYAVDDNGALIETTYEDKISTTKIGFMATLNYHIVNNDRIDFCFTAGAGYKNRSWKYESTDRAYESTSISSTLIPVAARIALNTRIFFTENIGANIGVGIGQGGILTAGLSFAL
tara:strand:- start:71 stop:733 length:663 start_codon:yes stop_codon:yes gene_type:complete